MIPEAILTDANILFSFFKKDSSRRHTAKTLLDRECKILSPHFILEELLSNKDKIIRFSKISEGEFILTLSTIEDEIKLIPEREYEKFFSKAKSISPHKKDEAYFALALSLEIPIWSDEKLFKKQLKVEIFSTSELLKL